MPLIIFGVIFFLCGLIGTIKSRKFKPSGTCPQDQKDAVLNKKASEIILIGSTAFIIIGIIVLLFI